MHYFQYLCATIGHWGLAMLVAMQRDEYGEPLVHGYHGLYFVMLGLAAMGFWSGVMAMKSAYDMVPDRDQLGKE